ncbi:MAG: PaaI family thioesterase [Schwartzia sp.]|nr:PaaI family thioesterase [Schwartzia sp. (in: firmicutes)]
MDKAQILSRLRDLYNTNPFVHLLGIVIDDAGPGWAKSHLTVTPPLLNMDGFLHGGALGTLIDNLCGVAGRTLGRVVLTQNISTSYIRNIPAGAAAHAECRVLHHGRHTMVMSVAAYSDEGKLLCEGVATMFVASVDERFTDLWEEDDVRGQ